MAFKHIGKDGMKFEVNLVVHSLENVPPKYEDVQVSWARGSKLALTKTVPARGSATFTPAEGSLSLIVTMYKNSKAKFDSKQYKVSLKRVTKKDSKSIGSIMIDIADFVGFQEAQTKAYAIPISGKQPVKLTVTIKSRLLSSVARGTSDTSSQLSDLSCDESVISTADADASGDAGAGAAAADNDVDLDDYDVDVETDQPSASALPEEHITVAQPTAEPKAAAKKAPQDSTAERESWGVWREKAESLERELTQLRADRSREQQQHTKQLADERTNANLKAAALERNLSAEKKRVQELTLAVESSKASGSGGGDAVLTSRIKQLEMELHEYQAQDEEMAQKEAMVRERISQGEATISALRRENTDLKNAMLADSVQNEVSTPNPDPGLQRKLADATAARTSLEKRVKELETERDQLKGQLQRAKAGQGQATTPAAGELQQLKLELERARTSREDLMAQLSVLSKEIETHKLEVEQANNKAAHTDRQMYTIVEEKKALEDQVEHLLQKVADANKQRTAATVLAESQAATIERLKKQSARGPPPPADGSDSDDEYMTSEQSAAMETLQQQVDHLTAQLKGERHNSEQLVDTIAEKDEQIHKLKAAQKTQKPAAESTVVLDLRQQLLTLQRENEELQKQLSEGAAASAKSSAAAGPDPVDTVDFLQQELIRSKMEFAVSEGERLAQQQTMDKMKKLNERLRQKVSKMEVQLAKMS